MRQRVVTLILVVLAVVACGEDTQHSTPSFISNDHHFGEGNQYVRMFTEHVHDETWHITYTAEVERDFEAALTIALQTWLQPLREIELNRDIVDDFEFYRSNAIDTLGTNTIAWDDVLFRSRFTAGSGGDKAGLYESTYFPPQGVFFPPIPDLPRDLPLLTVFEVDETATDITTDSYFMFVLMHEVGHGFGLADTYASFNADGTVNRQGNQPVSVMAGDYVAFAYPPILAADERVELASDDIRGLLWTYKRVTGDVDDITDCGEDYEYENSPRGCIPSTPPEPPPPEPPPPEPPTPEPPPPEPPPPEPPTPEPPTPEPPTPEPPTPEPPTTCAANPCADTCLVGCIYRSCGRSYANPDTRYRTSCYSKNTRQWCGSAGRGRNDVCRKKLPAQEPPSTKPRPPASDDRHAVQCCEEEFSCTAWPGRADIFLCRAAQEDEILPIHPSPCCQPYAYECDSWPGRASAALCFGL